MPDTSANTIKSETETKPKPRNKKGFREPTSLHVDPKLWQEVRIMAVLKNVSVTEYFEDALRRKLDIDNLEIGSQGYRVGQGGMYIPPPPATQEPQPEQLQQQEQIQGEEPPRRLSDRWAELNEEMTELGKVVEEYMTGEIKLNLPGLKFPVNKNKIIEVARKRGSNTTPVIKTLDRIPDKLYKNRDELYGFFKKAFREQMLDVATQIRDKLGPSPKVSKERVEQIRRYFLGEEKDQKQEQKITITI